LAGLVMLPHAVPQRFQESAKRGLLWFGLGLLVLIVAACALRSALLRGRSIRFRRRVARLRHALRSVSERSHVLLLGWLLGTCVQGTLLLLTARIAVYCGLMLPVKVWLFGWPLAKLAALLPLTQGGIGVREAALVALLAPFGAPGSLVLAAGLLWEGVIIAGGLIAGTVALLIRRFGLAKRRSASEAV